MLLVRIVAGLHLLVYLGIIWYGWQSYKTVRKKSWRYMGIGFTIFLIYRTRQFIKQLLVNYPVDTESTLIPFIGSVFLLVAFWMLCSEQKHLINLMAQPPSPLRAGAQSVEFWLEKFRLIVREEIAATRTTLTVTGPVVETPPEK